MTSVGDGISAESARWHFGGAVADSFDGHVSKSVPMYNEGHELICDFSDFFVKQHSVVYEFGTSTGTLLLRLAEHNLGKAGVRFIGIDIESDMISKAQEKARHSKTPSVEFHAADILDFELEPSDLIVSYYTLQFVSPAVRQIIVDKIYESLNWGGALLLFEKVRGADARFHEIIATLYNEYKLRQGYSPEEIISKSRSLKGVLEPFSTQGNLDLLRRAGFEDITTVQKYLSFEGFLAIK